VLSAAFFYSACPYYSKAEIYETAETDGIYYEGYHRDEVFIRKNWDGREVNRVLLGDRDIEKGYQYMESQIILKKYYDEKEAPVIPAVVYRCIEGPKDTKRPEEVFSECMPVTEIRSRYLVKSEVKKVALVEIDFLKIFDRSTGQLMAEYREIAKQPYAGAPYYPFFTWLNWHGDIFKANEYISCPEKSQYFSFQYEVLKVKK
jgi:hypothetical protein